MAGLFSASPQAHCQILDPGAGIGSLSLAFLERCRVGELSFDDIEVVAFETDDTLHEELDKFLADYTARLPLRFSIVGGDFVEEAVIRICLGRTRFTHAILNPPYKKIGTNSTHRRLIRKAGIETVNLYSAFLALAISLVERGGQIVAIVPRSFCNGPYYRSFRYFLLDRVAIRHMHLFGSRDQAFKDEQVLQENVIVLLQRGVKQGSVMVSTSTDDAFDDLSTIELPFDRIVVPGDPEKFIHFPASNRGTALDRSSAARTLLSELGLTASTGPVVDFRGLEHVRLEPEPETVPLLYPCHFSPAGVAWPKFDSRKPNAIVRNKTTEGWLYPAGYYCVVRRFSSKEERRRVVACVVQPADLGNPSHIGFENHLNVIHKDRNGLPMEIAYGLAAYLNSTAVDEQFRQFNGHTQVNATDLRQLKYPTLAALQDLGSWAIKAGVVPQEILDKRIERVVR